MPAGVCAALAVLGLLGAGACSSSGGANASKDGGGGGGGSSGGSGSDATTPEQDGSGSFRSDASLDIEASAPSSQCTMASSPTAYSAIGSGTAADPYILCNAAQLVALSGASTAWKLAFRLGADIDLSMNGPGSGSPFTMIGTAKVPFSGTFDGAGHVVSNLSLSSPSATDVGFFGLIQGGAAEVRSLNLVGANVVGSANVGILVGNSERGARILGCTTQGSVQGDNSVGGILGYGNLGPLVSSCASSASVKATGNNSWAGGIGGQLSQGVFIFNSYAIGDVTGNNNTGGLVGSIDSGGVFNSYATGTVTSTGATADGVGGFVGGVHGTIYQNCIATGDVVANTSVTMGVGRFAGEAPYGTFTHDSDLSTSKCQISPGQGCVDDKMGTTLADLQDATKLPLSAWDLKNTWASQSGQFPALHSALFDATAWDGCGAHGSDTPFAGGDGTPDRPYLICTAAQFAALGSMTSVWSGAYVEQMAAIDFTGSSATLTPIGVENNPFVGVYNGNGKPLSNFKMNVATGDVGLFGQMTGVVLRVAAVNGSVVAGSAARSAGMIAGNLYGALEDSYATGTVSGPTGVGGLGNAHTTAGGYAAVTVTATTGPAGGLNASGGNDGIVFDVFASSNVTAPSGMSFNLTPTVNGPSQVVDSFYDDSKCSGCKPIDAMGEATSYFYTSINAPMSAWDFDTIWMAQTGAFPTLR
jgi:hypothetical protein